MINKNAFFFWANDTMSWMRYMTLYSFRKYNPDWNIFLYLSKNSSKDKEWNGREKQDFFSYHNKKNYIPLLSDIGVEIVNVDIDKELSPPLQADLFRLRKLKEDSGIYFDLDILFTKPISDFYDLVSDVDIVINYNGKYFSIGMLGSSGNNNRFYSDLENRALSLSDKSDYQNLGTMNLRDLTREIHPDMEPLEIIARRYKEYTLFNHDYENIYPFHWNEPNKIWDEKITELPVDCFGIHWFAGTEESQKFNNILDEETVKNYDNTFSYFATKVMND